MKKSEIIKIVEDSLFNAVKETILAEQSNTVDKINIFNEQNNSLERFPSLSCFKQYISGIKSIKSSGENSKPGVIIDITNINDNEFLKCCNVKTLEEAQAFLIKSLHKDLNNSGLYIDQLSATSLDDEQLGTSSDYDIDVNMARVGDNLNIQIKIISGEKLGEEMKENVSKNTLLNALVEAKMKKKKKFVFENKTYDVEECNKEIDECGKTDVEECNKTEVEEDIEECGCDKKKKKVVAMTESGLIKMIKKIVVESDGIPGISVTKDVTKKAGEQNSEAISLVDKKLKDYLSFKGNSNSEFPNQNTGEKMVGHENTDKDNEFIDNNRGGGLQDYDYDTEPSDSFVERVRKALTGDPTMGNSSEPKKTANTVKTETGENIIKKSEKKKEDIKKRPMYNKDKQPVTTDKETESINENESIINEEIKRMKEIYNYAKKN